MEGGNGTRLVLAAERTQRPDPLNHFNIYVDGWNVTNSHYIAVSLSFLIDFNILNVKNKFFPSNLYFLEAFRRLNQFLGKTLSDHNKDIELYLFWKRLHLSGRLDN